MAGRVVDRLSGALNMHVYQPATQSWPVATRRRGGRLIRQSEDLANEFVGPIIGIVGHKVSIGSCWMEQTEFLTRPYSVVAISIALSVSARSNPAGDTTAGDPPQ